TGVQTCALPIYLGKAGTPTMGGVAVLLATLVVALGYGGFGATQVAMLLVLVAAGGLVLMDDLASLRRKLRRSRRQTDPDEPDEATGVLARYRILGHLAIGAGFALWAVAAGYLTTGVAWVDVLLYTFVMVGSINGFNFTDGLDGLAGGVSGI